VTEVDKGHILQLYRNYKHFFSYSAVV